jgi:hypothetical protein
MVEALHTPAEHHHVDVLDSHVARHDGQLTLGADHLGERACHPHAEGGRVLQRAGGRVVVLAELVVVVEHVDAAEAADLELLVGDGVMDRDRCEERGDHQAIAGEHGLPFTGSCR